MLGITFVIVLYEYNCNICNWNGGAIVSYVLYFCNNLLCFQIQVPRLENILMFFD